MTPPTRSGRQTLQRLAVGVVLLALTVGTAAQSFELHGRVVSIANGDTITLLTPDKQQYKIRLNGIDAPESGQDFGQVSKKHLAGLVFDKDVLVVG